MKNYNQLLRILIILSLGLTLTTGSYRTISRRQSQQLKCPAATGQFSHPTKCNYFINCWKGDVVEERCPASLLFNPKISACDWPRNVVCPGEEVNEPPVYPSVPDNNIPSNSEALFPEGGAPSTPADATPRPTYRPKPRPPFQPEITPKPIQQSTTEPPAFLWFKPKPPNRPGVAQPTRATTVATSTVPPSTSFPVLSTTGKPLSSSTLAPGAEQEQLPEFATNEPQPPPDHSLFPFPSWPTRVCSERESISGIVGHCDTVIICLSGKRHVLRCLPGQVFDPDFGSCMYVNKDNNNCRSRIHK